MFKFKRTVMSALAGLVLAAGATGVAAQAPEKVLRIVPQFDLKILDPIWANAFTTRNHGYMIYDTLFGVDSDGKVRPQMVDSYTHSDDGKTWTFTLREGLKFHDGAAVTTEDVLASLARWGKRDSLGQKLYAALDKIEAVDARTFRLTLAQPFGMVLEGLSKPSSYPPFIMPARIAATPHDQQITEHIGSGPYRFKQDEFRPGEKIVYLKNDTYVPRDEAPSGTAGGKQVYVDRVEWVIIRDAQTQVNALANGEVDLIEWIPNEHYETLRNNPKIELVQAIPSGSYALHMNHLVPPFDNPKIARAATLALNQEALLRAQIRHKELYRSCVSIYPCGSALASDKTAGFTGVPQFDEARKLLEEAGYDGKPVVLLYAPDFPVLNRFTPVLAQLLKQAGFNVDMQAMDWPTVLMRRTSKEPADKGGWNAFITGWGLPDTVNPLFFAPLTGNGEKGWFGWATDDHLEALKTEFAATSSDEERRRIAEAIQVRVFETGLFAPVGESTSLSAYRKDVVSGVVPASINVFWNIRKQ